MSNPHADRVRGALLQEWRVSQQLAESELAVLSNLSVAQILQLEGGGHSLFYTPAIKESAARKLACLLGGDPEAVVHTSGDSWSTDGSKVIEDLTLLFQQRSGAAKPASLLYRKSGWVLGPILVLMALVLASVWLQQKWHNGGSQQFWRETNRAFTTLAVELPTVPPAHTTPRLALPAEVPAAALSLADQAGF
jgi:transcriptional regulator with XRE-family HTH domain